MVTTQLRTHRRHLTCGGNLVYTENELGLTGYACLRCRTFLPNRKIRKGGSQMPFPKESKDAKDTESGRAVQLSKCEEKSLLLKEYHTTETYTLGTKATLYCETEEQVPITLFTFSKVVIEQLEAIKESLPGVIIHPQDMGTYQTIY